MKNFIFLLLTVSLVACGKKGADAPLVDLATERKANSGSVVGFTSEHGAHVWTGLPFAQPPVGDLRWRAPRATNGWTDTLRALEFAPSCAQPPSRLGGDESGGAEDCLYLNIYAPPMTAEAAAQADLPVLFWIHGGGNSIGSASDYDASILATQENVIVITTQYRLGPFGWFYHPEMAASGDSAADRSGNYGTLDLIEALRWTGANVKAFGGDPDNITIFGESAGGFNVFSLILAPAADGLFHKAISQSGSVRFADLDSAMQSTPNGSMAAAQRMIEATQVDDVGQLRNVSAADVLAAYNPDPNSGMISMPTIMHDGDVLTELPSLAAFEAGRFNKVPLMMGTNKDEAKLFQYMDPKYADTWFGIWTRAKNPEVYQRDARYKSEHWRLMGVEEPARSLSGVPIYAYRFDWDDLGTPLGMDMPLLFGAAHAFEIPFIFGGIGLGQLGDILDTTPNPQDKTALSESMMGYWGNFARLGDPNGDQPGLPEWQPWGETEQFLIFDAAADGGIRMSDDTITVAGLVGELVADTSFENQQNRCDLYRELLLFSAVLQPYTAQVGCG
ncbi:MAG: carboxylesterase family protein [Gammaproteobacteria bacterium]|nr:carboxylesterase family protein [Gammaproteobacteria bacterium]